MAEDFDSSIPIDTVVFAPEGSTTFLASESIAPEFSGQMCTVSAASEHQDSVHPDNDLIVESRGSVVVVENVEGGVSGVVTAESDIQFGSELAVSCGWAWMRSFRRAWWFTWIAPPCSPRPPPKRPPPPPLRRPAPTPRSTRRAPTAPEETTTTIDDEVLGTVITSTPVGDLQELPFTGPHNDLWVMVARSLLAVGAILVIGSRRNEDGQQND
jgi:hypothetical protein